MPLLEQATITRAVPRLTMMCVRKPAGFPAFSRCIPTIPPSTVAAIRRITTVAKLRRSGIPLVNSCHKSSMLVLPLVNSTGLEDQTLHVNPENPVILYLLLGCFDFSGAVSFDFSRNVGWYFYAVSCCA